MERKVRVVQYGCGRMGTYCMKFALEKGAELVGAFDSYDALIGKDVGAHIGSKKTIGVEIANAKDLKKILPEIEADIAIITTRSVIPEVFDVMKICAESGVNVISSCEEAIFPWNSSPGLVKELDEIAKKNNCTLCGSGAQELQWGSTIVNVASSFNNITKIVIKNINDSELYGEAFAKSYGVGATEEEFINHIAAPFGLSDEECEKKIKEGTFVPSFFWNSNEWLANRLGLTVSRQFQQLTPVYADVDLESKVLGRTVKAGEICGGKQSAITETKEGIIIEGSNIASIHKPGVPEACNFTIYDGEEKITVEEAAPPIPKMTCSILVNRIPDVINAEPGYLTTDNMPECKYLVKSLEQYVK